MSNYSVEITRTVQRQLRKLPNSIVEWIESKLIELENEPRPIGSIKLTDRNAYRIRVGNYRIIYEINDNILVVTVIRIAHRRDVY